MKNHYQCFKSYSGVLHRDKEGSVKVIDQVDNSVLIFLLFNIGLIRLTKHPLQFGLSRGFNPG
jgi:hypothetical protein